VTLAILAGGEGSRLGRPKGELYVGRMPILEFLLDRFAWGGDTLLVTAPGRQNPPGWDKFSRQAIDPVGGLGPLRGVLTAVENCLPDGVIIATVDMPRIGNEQIAWIATRGKETHGLGLMLKRQDIEPFPCFVRPQARQTIARHLAEGRNSVRQMSEVGFVTMGPPPQWDPNVWTNVNTPNDWATFLADGA